MPIWAERYRCAASSRDAFAAEDGGDGQQPKAVPSPGWALTFNSGEQTPRRQHARGSGKSA